MASRAGREIAAVDGEREREIKGKDEIAHPYAFHVSGPRNVSSPNWRQIINSSW